MRVFRRALLVVASVALVAACVDVPDGVRAQFAGPGPSDRSNFRKGLHGSAPPAEDPRPAAPAEAPGDAGTSPLPTNDADGGNA